MQSKLQELTEKLYNDGVSKARAEAETIISDAKSKATDIINDAKKEAEAIINESKKNAEETRTNLDSELKLSSKQALSAIKNEITTVITAKAVEDNLKDALAEPDFIKSVIIETLKSWSPDKDAVDLAVLLPAKMKNDLDKYLKSKEVKTLNEGLEVRFSDQVSSGFKIGPKDGSYLISFTDKDFENFFKAYLKPKTSELLYGG